MKITNEGQERHTQLAPFQTACRRCFWLSESGKKRQYSIVKTTDGDSKWLPTAAKSGRISTGWRENGRPDGYSGERKERKTHSKGSGQTREFV